MAENTKQISEDYYKTLFENLIDGLAYCQMLFDEQKHPIDFIYLDVNKNFEKLTGLKNVIGKKVTEVIPGIKESNPELLETYGRVALGGQSEKFEVYILELKTWFLVSVYGPKEEYFVVVFQNITEQKKHQMESEEVNKNLERINKLMVDRELRMVELKKEIKELKTKQI